MPSSPNGTVPASRAAPRPAQRVAERETGVVVTATASSRTAAAGAGEPVGPGPAGRCVHRPALTPAPLRNACRPCGAVDLRSVPACDDLPGLDQDDMSCEGIGFVEVVRREHDRSTAVCVRTD